MAWLDRRNSTLQAGLDRDMRRAARHLRRSDPVVAALVDRFGPYELRATTNAFQVMLETIVSQQLSQHAAASIYARLGAAMGGGKPRPRAILELTPDALLACGLSRSKALYVRNVAEAFARERITHRTFSGMNDEAIIARLTAIKGVGDWSAHMFLIFALNRLDVLPLGDLGLRKAMMSRYRLRSDVRPARLEKIADAWRPYRTVGTLYMWRGYDGA
ncbi:MAG TPA: DNA-3-methyladenine glycosylase 2 family protein [Candidatus Krumholzibacteria bacterium]|nr:DNA-3-methyladenine glycosylase 2 family protein [Candidatus Krumholzibacteria bacterium]